MEWKKRIVGVNAILWIVVAVLAVINGSGNVADYGAAFNALLAFSMLNSSIGS